MFNLSLKKNLDCQKIITCATSPDRQSAALGAKNGMVYVCDRNAEVIRKLGKHNDFVSAVVFKNNTTILSSGKDRSIREWKEENFVRDWAGIVSQQPGQKTMESLRLRDNRKTHALTILSMDISHQGNLVTGSQDRCVKYWKNEEPLRTFDWHEGPVTCVRFCPGTEIFFSASRDKTVRSWNINDGSVINKYKDGRSGEYLALTFLDAENFVTGDDKGNIFSWKVGSERPKSLLGVLNTPIAALVTFKKYLIAACHDGSLRQIDLSDGNESDKIRLSDSEIRCVGAMSETVFCGDNEGNLFMLNVE